MRKSGFTLLELLVSMGLLVVITMMMSRIFTDTNRMWAQGTKRVTEAQEGRFIADFLVQQLTVAYADELVSFRAHSTPGDDNFSEMAYGLETDSIAFVAPIRTPPDVMRRSAMHFIYFVDYMRDEMGDNMDQGHERGPRYRLARVRKTRSTHAVGPPPGTLPEPGLFLSAYKNDEWWRRPNWEYELEREDRIETVANNIVAFEVWCYDQDGNLHADYDSTQRGPPLFLDLFLQVMGEPEISEAVTMFEAGSPDTATFIERNSRRYSIRVHMRNTRTL